MWDVIQKIKNIGDEYSVGHGQFLRYDYEGWTFPTNFLL